MKKLLIIPLFIFVIIGCSTTSKLRTPHSQMKKNDNTIILKVGEPIQKTFKNFHQYLFDNNYKLEIIDDKLMRLKTEYKTFGHYSLAIYAKFKGDSTTTIILTGKHNPLGVGPGIDVYNTTAFLKKTMKKSWHELAKVASSYPHSKLMYERR